MKGFIFGKLFIIPIIIADHIIYQNLITSLRGGGGGGGGGGEGKAKRFFDQSFWGSMVKKS